MRSVRNVLSRVRICDTLATDVLGSPDALGGSKTLPGAAAKRVFDVIATTIIVPILL